MQMRGVKRLLIGSFLVLLSSLAYGQAGFGQADPPLNFGNNYFVTGDYVVAGAYGLNNVGGSGFATGTINIPDKNNIGLTGANQVPAGAQIVKALLYWQTVEKVAVVPGQPGSGQNGLFRPVFTGGPKTAYAMSGVSVTNSSTVSWSSGGCTGSSTGKLLRTYRADVTGFLPQDAGGNLIVNGTVNGISYGAYEVSLPSTGNNTPLTLGATLVIIFRVLSPDYPLNSIVIYDGDFAPGNVSLTMTQTVQGFYDAAHNPVSRLTHIVGNGKSNKDQTVYLNGQALPFLYGGLSAFPGHYGSWDTVTWTFDDPNNPALAHFPNPVHEDDSSATTEVIPSSSNQGCVAWGAVIVSTTVKNSDGDGLLDVWKQPKAPNNPLRPGYCDASVNEGVCTQGDTNWVDLPEATKGKKDVFVQLDYMCSIVTGGDSCDTTNGYSFDPRLTVDPKDGKSSVQKVVDAYSAKGITLHINPTPNSIHAIPEPTCTDIVGPPQQLCIFPNQPGVVAWKGDVLFYKNQFVDPDEPAKLADCSGAAPEGDCIPRFQPAKKDSYHYSLWAHTLGIPNWTLLGGSLASAMQSGNMLTLKTSTPHGLTSYLDPSCNLGRVTIAYAITNQNLNGTYCVLSSSDQYTFTIQVPNSLNATYTPNTDPDFAVVSGNALESGTVSGFSDIGGADSLITLGSWGANGQAWQIKASTFMHELGHSNGLTHGGFYFDSLTANNKNYTPTIEGNCKSNFQSVMTYEGQLLLLNTGKVDGLGKPIRTVDYSGQYLNAINEGIAQSAPFFTTTPTYPNTFWYEPWLGVGQQAKGHCDGTPLLNTDKPMFQHEGMVTTLGWSTLQDLNFDGIIETVGTPMSPSGLRGHNDWADTVTGGVTLAPGINLQQVSAAGSMSSSGAKGFGGGGGAKGFGGGGGAKGFGGGGGAKGFGGGGGAKGFGGGGGAGELNVETANAQTYPPQNLTVSEAVSPRTITLNWAEPAFGQIVKYYIYRSAAGAPFQKIGNVAGNPPATTFTDTVACNAGGYQYFVTAVILNPGEQESPGSNTVTTGNDGRLTGCYIVTGPSVAASAIQGSKVGITWTVQDDFNTRNGPVNNGAANTLVAIGPISNDTSCGPVTNNTPRTTVLLNGSVQGNGTNKYGMFVGNGAGGFTFTLDTSLFNAGCYFFQLNLDSGQSPQSSALQLLIFVSDNGPYITTTSPLVPDGVVGSAYTTTLDEAGGQPPVTWNIVSCSACSPGTPPPGITLNSATATTATLSGTPTSPGLYTFQVNVTDSVGNTGTPQTLTLRVADALPGDLIVVDGAPTANPLAGTILRVTQTGTTTGTIATVSSGQPTGVAVDANTGNIYAAVAPVSGSGTPGVVQVVGPYGAVANPFGPVGVLQNPVAVAVDSSGNVYVGDNKANAIYEFNSSGTQVGAGAFAPLPTSGGVANHIRMTFDSTGNLIVASDNVGGTFGIVEVDKFDSSANKTVLYNTTTNAGLTDPLTAVNASATIMSFAITSNIVTFQAVNSFTAGTNVQISSLSVGTYLNGQVLTVISSGLSGTQFEANFTNPDVASTADSGTATAQAATYVGTFSPPLPAGSSVTISGFTNPGNNGTFTVQKGSTSSQLVVNNPNGVTETNPGTATFGIATVGGVATFPDGSIDVADFSMQTIYKITTTPSLTVAPDLNTTNALCCNISGMTNPSEGTTLFVTLDQAAKMQKAVPPSTITNILSGAPLTFPNDVATYSKH
jgi:hypothetical protein